MRKILITAVAAGVLLGGGVGYVVTHGSSPTSANASTQRRAAICDYLDDGGGVGAALSAKPGTPPPPSGQRATVQKSGAWNTCYGTSGTVALLIWLQNDSGVCLDTRGGLIYWDPCDTASNYLWHRQSGAPAGGYVYTNQATGEILCAGGAGGSFVLLTTPSLCSNGHQSWRFENLPIKQR